MDLLFGQSGAYTERRLVFLGQWEPWLQVLVALVAVGVIALTIYNYRGLLPAWRRFMLVGLRVLIVLVLVAVFYQPAFLEENISRSRNQIAVLADVSESMSLPQGKGTRADLVAKFMARSADWWSELAEDNDIAFYGFGEDIEPLPDPLSGGADLGELVEPRQHQTRIVRALEEVRKRHRNRDIGGVFVLTDGVDTTPAGRRPELDHADKRLVRDLDAPIHTFTITDSAGLEDVAIAHVAYNNFAFLMNVTHLEASVRVHGYPVGNLGVTLSENGQEVARQLIDLEASRSDYQVAFEFVPRKLGKQVFTVSVDEQPDEVYLPNNHEQVIINVIRDKIRVLQIVGQPSWDERFLRNHLKSDPDIDLISFFILVNAATPPLVSAAETALIPFPAQELFEEELGGFDLVIFQNFNYGPFHTRQYLPYIARYVLDGGAFLMIGGPLSLSAGGYYGTEITEILPVDIPLAVGPESTLDTSPFRLRLADAGRYHPIMRLHQDPEANARIWSGMEPLEGVNKVTRPKPGAVVLATHPTLRDETGAPMPVVAVAEPDDGRSMVVTTDSTWAWSFKAGNAGKDPRHYDAFWSNAIQWLIKDPELDLLRVHAFSETFALGSGEPARARVEVFQPDYRPAKDHPVDVTVRLRGPSDGSGEGKEIMRLAGQRTDSEGQLEVAVPLAEPGVYEIEARSTIVSGRTARATDIFVATEENPEFETVIGDGRLVAALARESGGEVRSLESGDPVVPLREPRVVKVSSRRHRELWNVPAVLLLLVALFTLEWSIRRKYGYL